MRSSFGRYGFNPHPIRQHSATLRRAFTGHPMIHDETVRDLQALITDIDREMARLRATLREGEKLRETLIKQAMALAWESEGDPSDQAKLDRTIVRVVKDPQ